MCYAAEDRTAFESSSWSSRKRAAFFKRRRTMLPPSSRVRFFHEVEDDGPHVTFQESKFEVHEIPTALSRLGGGADDRHQLWYNKADIREFRRQAQSLSKRLRDESESCTDQYTRGLELRTSLERQERKRMILKRILDAQDDDCEASELAQIAEEHSVWSRKVALAQAHKDYYSAYHPQLTSVLPEMPPMLDCRKDMAKKRSLSSFEQPGRRVRCRMF